MAEFTQSNPFRAIAERFHRPSFVTENPRLESLKIEPVKDPALMTAITRKIDEENSKLPKEEQLRLRATELLIMKVGGFDYNPFNIPKGKGGNYDVSNLVITTINPDGSESKSRNIISPNTSDAEDRARLYRFQNVRSRIYRQIFKERPEVLRYIWLCKKLENTVDGQRQYKPFTKQNVEEVLTDNNNPVSNNDDLEQTALKEKWEVIEYLQRISQQRTLSGGNFDDIQFLVDNKFLSEKPRYTKLKELTEHAIISETEASVDAAKKRGDVLRRLGRRRFLRLAEKGLEASVILAGTATLGGEVTGEAVRGVTGDLGGMIVEAVSHGRLPNIDMKSIHLTTRYLNQHLQEFGKVFLADVKKNHSEALQPNSNDKIESIQPSDRPAIAELPPQTVGEWLKPEMKEKLTQAIIDCYFQDGSFKFSDETAETILLTNEINQRCHELAQNVRTLVTASNLRPNTLVASLTDPRELKKDSLVTSDLIAREFLTFYEKSNGLEDGLQITSVKPNEQTTVVYELGRQKKSAYQYDVDSQRDAVIRRRAILYAEQIYDQSQVPIAGDKPVIQDINTVNKIDLSKVEWWASQSGKGLSDRFVMRAIELHMAGEIDLNQVMHYVDITKFLEKINQQKAVQLSGAALAVGIGAVLPANQDNGSSPTLSRRRFLQSAAATGVLVGALGGQLVDNTIKDPTKILEQLNGDLKKDVLARLPKLCRDNLSTAIPGTARIFAAGGTQEIGVYIGEGKREGWVTYEEVKDTDLVKALVATEDANFWEHPGVDSSAIVRAGALRGGGASTLTQQVVRNLVYTEKELAEQLTDNEKRNQRKATEIVLSLMFEKMLEDKYALELHLEPRAARVKAKEKIIELYLNIAPFGPSIRGLKTATNIYFGKNPQNLSREEAIFMAGLPNRPYAFDPQNPDAVDKDMEKELGETSGVDILADGRLELNHSHSAMIRMKTVLGLMEDNGSIKPDERNFLRYASIKVNPPKKVVNGDLALFTSLHSQVVQGAPDLAISGFQAETTIDFSQQKAVEKVIATFLERNTGAAKQFNIDLASAIVMNKKGEVVAMIGDIHRAISPASTVKLATLTEAVADGEVLLNPETKFNDNLPVTIKMDNGTTYTPHNFNGTNHGIVGIGYALAQSLNKPFIELTRKVGLLNQARMMRQIGYYDDLDPGELNYPQTLGTLYSSLINVARAGLTIANDGVRVEPTYIKKVINNEDKVVYSRDTSGSIRVRIMLASTASWIKKALSDGDRWFKTGTSSLDGDKTGPVLIVGGKGNYVIAVYGGRQDGQALADNATARLALKPVFDQIANALN